MSPKVCNVFAADHFYYKLRASVSVCVWVRIMKFLPAKNYSILFRKNYFFIIYGPVNCFKAMNKVKWNRKEIEIFCLVYVRTDVDVYSS